MNEDRAQNLMARVQSVFPPEVEEEAKREIAAALRATKSIRKRDENGVIGYVDVPDTPLRVSVGIKILEFNIGKPVQSSIVANLNPGEKKNGSETTDLLKLMFSMPRESAEILMKLRAAAQKLESGELNVTPELPEGDNSTS